MDNDNLKALLEGMETAALGIVVGFTGVALAILIVL